MKETCLVLFSVLLFSSSILAAPFTDNDAAASAGDGADVSTARVYTLHQAQAMGLLQLPGPSASRSAGVSVKSYSETSSATGYGYGIYNFISFPLSTPTSAEWGDENSVKICAGARKGTDVYLIEYTLDDSYSIHPLNLLKRDMLTDSVTTVCSLNYDDPIVVDMAYSAMTGLMYALGSNRSTGNEALYAIDLETGEFTKVGADYSVHYFGLAANRGGMLYAVNSTAGLVRINPSNGIAESIGSYSLSNRTAAYICSMDFDLSTETLYWALCDEDAYSYLIKIDPETGQCKQVGKIATTGQIEEVTAMHISLPTYDDDAPAQVDGLTVTADASGGTSATVTWTNPTTTVGGSTLETIASVQVSVNGTVKEEITTATPGATSSVTLSGLTTGFIRVDVVATSGGYSSEPAEGITWVGQDVPREPTDIAAERTNASLATVTWTAPTESVHGGYLKTSSLKYRIVRYDSAGDSVILAKTYKQDNCYLDSTITTLDSYYYKIQSLTSDYGLWDYSEETLLGPPLEIPYSCTFASASEFAKWTTIDNNGDGTSWVLWYSYGYTYHRASSVDCDDWLVSPPLHLEADSTYYIYFETYTGRGEWYPKHFQVTVGQNSDPTQNPVYLDYSFASKIVEQARVALPVTADGEYYVAIHDISDYNIASLQLSNFIVQAKHTGWLTGTVTDASGNPIEDVDVTVVDSNICDTTATDGSYKLDFLSTGTYYIQYSKVGWEIRTDTLTFTNDVETVNNAILTAKPSCSVACTVTDTNGDAIVAGKVTVSGYGDDVILTTDSTGSFSTTLYEAGYWLDIDKVKYISYSDTLIIEGDSTMSIVLSPKILAPSDFTATAQESSVKLKWDIPRDIFRHDDGTMVSQLGSLSGTEKYVNGAVFRTPAILKSMSWMTTSYQGPHEEMNLWIFDITEDYYPTNTVLFNVMGVPQEDEVWNYYELPEPVECPRGFFLGVSYSYGMSSLATDSGTDEEYPFISYTNYCTSDYTTNVWTCKDASSIKKNHLIRATGDEIGDNPQTYDYRYRLWRLAEEYLTDQDQWTLLTTNAGTADTVYIDDTAELESGNYYYAVEAVYPSGASDLVYSDLVTVESSGVTAASIAANFTVAPVPATETLYTSLECDKIEIIGLDGHTAATATSASSIDVSALTPGVYLLRATVAGTPIIKQIIIK